MNVFELFAGLGISFDFSGSSDLDMFFEDGSTLVVKPTNALYTHLAQKVVIPPGLATLIETGKMGNVTKTTYQNRINAAITKVLADLATASSAPDDSDDEVNDTNWDAAQPPDVIPTEALYKKPAATATENKSVASKDLKALLSFPPVPMLAATQIYQPVKGSSSSSRYFLVAKNDEVSVALRWQNTTLSVRVEGKNIEKHTPRLKEIGLTDGGAKHCSLHVTVETDMQVYKALGAVICGLQMAFPQHAVDLKPIHNMGA